MTADEVGQSEEGGVVVNDDRLKDISDEALTAELARRRAVRAGIPEPLPDPDFSKVEIAVVDGIKRAYSKQYLDDNFKQYIYEAAVEAVYGPAFWTWRNAQRW